MTETPEQFGPLAGAHADDPQRIAWLAKRAAAIDAQQMNSQTIHQLATRGIQGADAVALMTRVNVLIDVLFGTVDGYPGFLSSMLERTARLDIEIKTQQTIAAVLENATRVAEQAQQQAGIQHQTQSGIIVPGNNWRPTS